MGVASALYEAGGDEHPSPGGSPKAAHDAIPRCQLRGIGIGIHAAHPSHAFEISSWSNYTPLYTFEVLLQSSHIPQCEHHAQGGLSS